MSSRDPVELSLVGSSKPGSQMEKPLPAIPWAKGGRVIGRGDGESEERVCVLHHVLNPSWAGMEPWSAV